MNQELPDAQAVFTKGRGTRSNCQHLLVHRENAKEFQKIKKKKSASVSLTVPKALTVWITEKYGKFLKTWE